MTVENLGSLICVVALTAVVGCERASLDCPGIDPGALVVTEISGDNNALGQWIEIYNDSSQAIGLLGLRVELTTLDGGSTQEFTVRRDLSIAPGAYLTLGRFDDVPAEAHIDYGYKADLDNALLSTAAVELVVCGVEVDQVVYRDLPDDTALAFDGAKAPNAVENDTESNFCIDAGGGTPGEENTPCS